MARASRYALTPCHPHAINVILLPPAANIKQNQTTAHRAVAHKSKHLKRFKFFLAVSWTLVILAPVPVILLEVKVRQNYTLVIGSFSIVFGAQ